MDRKIPTSNLNDYIYLKKFLDIKNFPEINLKKDNLNVSNDQLKLNSL